MAGCCACSIIFYGVCALGLYGRFKLFQKWREQRKLGRWSKTPKDVLIIHCPPRGKLTPNPSPWPFKVETYCRMANIPYKVDHKDPFGAKGKTPWISYNGQHIADSQLIVQFLGKKLEKNFSKNYSEEQLALATAVRIMLEEQFFWGLRLEVFVYGTMESLQRISGASYFELLMLKIFYGWEIRNATTKQGLYRHTKAEITEMMIKNLRAVSKILGNKKFICGDEPCEDDCAILGMLSGPVWNLPGTIYEDLINGELINLKEYCFRMKEKFWPDWDSCLAR